MAGPVEVTCQKVFFIIISYFLQYLFKVFVYIRNMKFTMKGGENTMRKALIAVLTLGILSAGAVAFAGWGGPGGPGWGPGPGACGGPSAYGQAPCGGTGAYGGPGWQSQSEEAKKFLEDTSALRRELHTKMFEYREAYRAGDEKKLESLDKEIAGLQEKLDEKAKEAGISGSYGYGPRKGYGPGPRWRGPRGGGYGPGACGGPGGWGGSPRW